MSGSSSVGRDGARSVALCMIVRDEEEQLPGCLASVRGLCGELVVVDTGSRDRTVAIAEAAGARVVRFPWCDDFAAARNAGLREAASDWVLVLDADERLAEGAAARIRAQLERETGDCGMVRLHDANALDASPADVLSGRARLGEPMVVPRLLRRTPDLAFHGIVHESVRPWLVANGNKVWEVDADIVHYGAVPSLRSARGKTRRNTSLLEKRLALEPDNFALHGYLAHEHLAVGDDEAARRVADEGFRRLVGATPETLRSAIRLMVARCVLQLKAGDPDGALDSVARTIAYEGESPDALFFRGRAHEQRAFSPTADRDRELALAAEAYLGCLAWEGRFFAQRFVRGASGWAGTLRLGTVRLLEGRAAEALALFEASHREEPTLPEAALGAVEALVALGRTDEALTRLAPLLASAAPDALLLAAYLADTVGDVDEMKRLLATAREKAATTAYVGVHRNALHATLLCELTAYLGRPQPGRGAVGTACARMGGAAASGRIGAGERRGLVAFLRNLVARGQVALVERLLGPEAEAALPGVEACVREAVGALGMTLEERP